MAYPTQRGGGATGGGSGGGGTLSMRKIIVEASGVLMENGTAEYELPDPAAGKRYERLEFRLVTALANAGETLDNLTRTSGSDGVYVDIDDNESSWYRTIGPRSRWYAGGSRTGTQFIIGTAHGGGTARWSVEYVPADDKLVFNDHGVAQQAWNRPYLTSALILAKEVDV